MFGLHICKCKHVFNRQAVFVRHKPFFMTVLFNEQLELLDAVALRENLLKEYNETKVQNLATITEGELEKDLQEWYNTAEQINDNDIFGVGSKQSEKIGIFGIKKIWERIRKVICKILATGSTASEIIDAVLSAIAAIIPGGIVIRWILNKILRYILDAGYQRLCPVV